MEINTLGDSDEFKYDTEVVDTICRSCLTTAKPMYDVYQYAEEIAELTGIHVSSGDGLPRWVCAWCRVSLRRATRQRRQWLRAHRLLYDYLTRCAPFPLDARDAELRRYASCRLRRARTLAFDNCTHRAGYHAPLQHEKEYSPSPLDEVPLPPPRPPPYQPALPLTLAAAVKEEDGRSDYEDDIPLHEFKNNVDKVTADALTRLLEAEGAEGVEGAEGAVSDHNEEQKEPARDQRDQKGTRRHRKREREPRQRNKKKTRGVAKCDDTADDAKRSLRRVAEDVDPTKIRLITLDPEEQLKQLQEDSECGGARLPYRCALCYKGFNYQNKLDNHMRRHSPSRGPFSCSLCRTYVPTRYSLAVHMRVHTQRYECLKCGRRMVDRGSIVEHYRSQHEGILHQYTCHLCGKHSSNSKTHRGHMRNHHGGARPACARCGKTFVNNDSLAEHVLIHEGVKNYACEQCGQRFRTKNQAKHHQLKHSDIREHYCVECDVRFKSAHNLRQHLQKSLKHKDPKTFKYECGECGKRFESAALRSRHSRVQHLGERSFACRQCGAALASAASLAKHERAHLRPRAEPTHVCHTCGRAFRGKSVLVNHVRTHTGEKPFACATCGRRFAQRTACSTHVRLVHLKLRRNHIKPEAVPVSSSTEQDIKPPVEVKPPQAEDDKMAAADLVSYVEIPSYF